MSDPTPDLAAIRARHHSWTDRSGRLVCAGAHHDYPCDVAVLLEAFDAQAARLAAVEQAVADNQWMHESHAVERANVLRPRGYCAVCHDSHPCDTISLLEDVEAALKGGEDGD